MASTQQAASAFRSISGIKAALGGGYEFYHADDFYN